MPSPKSYKSFFSGLSGFCVQVIFGQIVAIHPQEDFNQIWLQAFFEKNKYESNFFILNKREKEKIVLLFLATYSGTKNGNKGYF
jgi:hypothetical protein